MDGLFLFDKPQGITSHDAVARCRRWFGTRRVGHAGTLDPMATGLLVICVNSATRMSEYVLGQDKTYLARVRLGERTNTDDADGEVIARAPVPVLDADRLADAANRFVGLIRQTPPQYSAIKKGGVRAYALARKGEAVELDARPVTVYALALERTDGTHDQLDMRVECGSGVYVRALARDLGEYFGCGGHLTMLRRLRIGAFHVSDAMTEAGASALARDDASRLRAALRPMDQALAGAPSVVLSPRDAVRLLNGQALALSSALPHPAPLVRAYDEAGRFLAVAEFVADTLRPVKVFTQTHANAD